MIELVSIYTLAHPTTGEVRYVGLTRDVKARLRQYRHGGHTKHLHNWLRSLCGPPVLIVLEQVPVSAGDARERHWISLLLTYGARLINYTSGGEGNWVLAPEARTAVRDHQNAQLQDGTHNFLRPEVRERQRRASSVANSIPKPWVAATIIRVNKSRIGIPLTAEHKARVSAALRGRRHTPESRAKMRVAALRRYGRTEESPK